MEQVLEGLNLEKLLAPIADAAPAGTDLRQDFSSNSLYYRLRDARAEARTSERAIESGGLASGPAEGGASVHDLTAAALANWRIVRELATEALSSDSKDLEIATWLTEALLRTDGLVGLAAGCRLLAGLADGFWDEFFPQPDEDGLAGRLACVAGLNGMGGAGTLVQPLRRIRLFERGDGTPLELWQYEQSRDVAGIGDAAVRQQRLAAGILPFEVVESEARQACGDVFSTLGTQAAEACEAWQTFGEVFDRHAGADAPATSHIRGLLEQIKDVAKLFAVPATDGPEEPPLATLEQPAGVVATSRPVSLTGAFASREDALRALGQIADFFRRTEPHSPLAYTLQEAVRRGRMTWPELLAEIVPDPTSRSAILSSLGIRPPTEE